MALGAVLAEAEDRAARHNFAAVRQEVHDHLLQVEQRRLAVPEGDHVHAEALLHLRHLEEVVEHDLGHGALLEVDADAELLRGLVAHFGDALDIIPALGETFDLVFIDADKRLYSEYFDLVFPMVRAGGLILADNTLWDGHVVEEHPKDKQTLGILSFNDKIKEDPRIEKVILPLRDGLTMIWKK